MSDNKNKKAPNKPRKGYNNTNPPEMVIKASHEPKKRVRIDRRTEILVPIDADEAEAIASWYAKRGI